nr:LEAF RUST 10 DISEASE-RESISTANCE LOCUS RECEPTOR-LIKE PROTEIN KINASE-like 2.1 isoform X1 [Ipomoea batatas]
MVLIVAVIEVVNFPAGGFRWNSGDKVTLGAKICIGIGGVALCVVVFCIIFCAYLRGKKRYPSGNKLDMQGSGNCSGNKEAYSFEDLKHNI